MNLYNLKPISCARPDRFDAMLNALASIRSILETSGYPDGETGMTFPYGAVHCYGKDTVLTPGTEETFAYLALTGGVSPFNQVKSNARPANTFYPRQSRGLRLAWLQFRRLQEVKTRFAL